VRRTPAELGVQRSTFYAWYRRYTEDGVAGWKRRSRRPSATGIVFPRRAGPRRHGGIGRPGALAARAGLAAHGSDRAFPLGIERLSHPEGRDLITEPGLHPAPGGRPVCPPDAPAERAVANRLHVPEGHRLGLVLPVDGPRRLLAVHPGLDAHDDDAGDGRDDDTRSRAGEDRGRSGPGRPSAPAPQRQWACYVSSALGA
jgi:hypothetical protein